MEFRRIKPEDYKDIHALNEKLGYSYDEDKVCLLYTSDAADEL